MDRKQTGLIILLVLLMILAVIVAGYFGPGTTVTDASLAKKRFTARAGTTRRKAIALSSKKRSQPRAQEAPPAAHSGQQSSRKNPIPVKSLSAPNDENLSPAERLAREATNSLSPESGIDKLQQALDQPQTPEEAALLQTAIGNLYAQLEPPDYTKAQAAFDMALSTAPVLEMRQRITQQYAALLLYRGAPELARAKIQAALAEPGPVTAPGLELNLQLARIHERSGARDQAETVYKYTLEQSAETAHADAPEMIDLMRLSSLCLVRLYRAEGRGEEADALAKQFKTRLKALAATPPPSSSR